MEKTKYTNHRGFQVIEIRISEVLLYLAEQGLPKWNSNYCNYRAKIASKHEITLGRWGL
jgi:hypothetical protein